MAMQMQKVGGDGTVLGEGEGDSSLVSDTTFATGLVGTPKRRGGGAVGEDGRGGFGVRGGRGGGRGMGAQRSSSIPARRGVGAGRGGRGTAGAGAGARGGGLVSRGRGRGAGAGGGVR